MASHVVQKKLSAVLRSVEAACASRAWSSDDEGDVLAAVTELESKTCQLPMRMKTEECDDDNKLERLWEWAKSAGAVCHPNVRLETCGEGSGMFATGDIAANEPIVVVPPRLVLTASRGARDRLAAVLEASGMHPTVALAVRLIRERHLGEKSTFAAYVASLPRSYDTPLSFDLASLRRLGSLFRQACGSRRAAARYYVELTRATKIRDCVGLIGWDEWIWAMSAVVTRQNSLPGGLCLVALWDSCNHALEAPRTEFLEEGQQLELRAAQDLSRGNQIFMFYGKRSDSELVMHSGFRLGNNNPYDLVSITIHQLPPSPITKLVVSLLRGADAIASAPTETTQKWTGHLQRADNVVVPDSRLRAIGLAAVATDKSRLAHLMRTSNTDHTVWQPLDAEHDEAARCYLLNLCDARAATIVANRAVRLATLPKQTTARTRTATSHRCEIHDDLASGLFESELAMLLDGIATLRHSSFATGKSTSDDV